VVDPQRGVDIYLDAACQHGVLIAHIIETHANQFCSGHAPGSIHIGLGGQFASWAGSLIGLDR
jgi:hypothetical protein